MDDPQQAFYRTRLISYWPSQRSVQRRIQQFQHWRPFWAQTESNLALQNLLLQLHIRWHTPSVGTIARLYQAHKIITIDKQEQDRLLFLLRYHYPSQTEIYLTYLTKVVPHLSKVPPVTQFEVTETITRLANKTSKHEDQVRKVTPPTSSVTDLPTPSAPV